MGSFKINGLVKGRRRNWHKYLEQTPLLASPYHHVSLFPLCFKISIHEFSSISSPTISQHYHRSPWRAIWHPTIPIILLGKIIRSGSRNPSTSVDFVHVKIIPTPSPDFYVISKCTGCHLSTDDWNMMVYVILRFDITISHLLTSALDC